MFVMCITVQRLQYCLFTLCIAIKYNALYYIIYDVDGLHIIKIPNGVINHQTLSLVLWRENSVANAAIIFLVLLLPSCC